MDEDMGPLPWDKIIIFDVDGTLTHVRSVWEHLHRELGIWESQGYRNLQAYLSGEIDYGEFARRDASGYKDVVQSRLEKIVADIPRRHGLKKAFRKLRQERFHIALVSTGLNILVDQIEGVDTRVANELIFESGICTGEVFVRVPIGGKMDVFNKLLRETNLDPRRTVAVGDSRGDLEVMGAAGVAIAVDPVCEEVRRIADITVTGRDLIEVAVAAIESFSG